MIILGLNGTTERGHDAGATLMIDGKLILAVEEEKLIGKRHSYDRLPIESIDCVLSEAKITPDQVDRIIIGWDMPRLYESIGRRFFSNKEFSDMLIGSDIWEEKLCYIKHHLAHAYSTFSPSKYQKALVMVIDGQGEVMGTSVFIGDRFKNDLRLVYETPISLGYFYSAVTRHIGFKGGEEGKTMGLAAYGKPVYFEQLKKLIDINFSGLSCQVHVEKKSLDEESETLDKWRLELNKVIDCRETIPIDKINSEIIAYANLAASAQKLLDFLVVGLARKYLCKYNLSKICVAGGVGLNCTTNSALERINGVNGVFVQPASNDGGISLGAAIYGAIEAEENITDLEMTPYIGPKLSLRTIRTELAKLEKKYHFKMSYEKNIEQVIARLLFNEKIVANFQGRLEFGPRALGNRSILASPKRKKMMKKINQLKGRELWRPLAPAVLYQEQEKYFSSKNFLPFMIKNSHVNKEKEHLLRAVTHIDGTARVQSVVRRYNPKFYGIIEEFYKLSDVPVVVNTSFNIKGQPLVSSVDNAVKSAVAMHLDYLAIENYLIEIPNKNIQTSL